MVTYIKYKIKNHYVELESELDPELYDNIGESWDDYLNNKWIQLSSDQLKFKEENPYASVKEVFEMKLTELPVKTLEQVKDDKRKYILDYDSSKSVNIFYINGLEVWLDKATRTGLKLRFEAEIAVGQTDTTLWYNNMQFPLLLEDAVQMLYAIEIYASECYDNTQKHLAEVSSLNTIEEVEAYDYTTGYPDKLNF